MRLSQTRLPSLPPPRPPARVPDNLYNGVTNALLLVDLRGREELFYALFAVNGMAFGGQFLIDSVLSDMIDYDELRHGDRIEGTFGTIGTLVPKVVSAFTSAAPLAALHAAGFVQPVTVCPEATDDAPTVDGPACAGAPQPQPEHVVWLIRLLAAGVPTVVCLLSFILKWHFPIRPELSGAILDGVGVHQADGQVPVRDPVTGEVRRQARAASGRPLRRPPPARPAEAPPPPAAGGCARGNKCGPRRRLLPAQVH